MGIPVTRHPSPYLSVTFRFVQWAAASRKDEWNCNLSPNAPVHRSRFPITGPYLHIGREGCKRRGIAKETIFHPSRGGRGSGSEVEGEEIYPSILEFYQQQSKFGFAIVWPRAYSIAYQARVGA